MHGNPGYVPYYEDYESTYTPYELNYYVDPQTQHDVTEPFHRYGRKLAPILVPLAAVTKGALSTAIQVHNVVRTGQEIGKIYTAQHELRERLRNDEQQKKIERIVPMQPSSWPPPRPTRYKFVPKRSPSSPDIQIPISTSESITSEDTSEHAPIIDAHVRGSYRPLTSNYNLDDLKLAAEAADVYKTSKSLSTAESFLRVRDAPSWLTDAFTPGGLQGMIDDNRRIPDPLVDLLPSEVQRKIYKALHPRRSRTPSRHRSRSATTSRAEVVSAPITPRLNLAEMIFGSEPAKPVSSIPTLQLPIQITRPVATTQVTKKKKKPPKTIDVEQALELTVIRDSDSPRTKSWKERVRKEIAKAKADDIKRRENAAKKAAQAQQYTHFYDPDDNIAE